MKAQGKCCMLNRTVLLSVLSSNMPSRNILKMYVNNGFYHVYNRGVEKRTIFEDKQDYKVFLKYIKEILSPIDPDKQSITFYLRGQTYKAERKLLKNYSDEIELLAYCLMPNHFHFLIRQKNKKSLQGFMSALMTRYSMYFNKRYKRVGTLFQGRYKAVLVYEDAYLLHLSRYIHLNPLEYTPDLERAYSSYADYLGRRKTSWIKPNVILRFFNSKVLIDFKKINSYKNFVEKYNKANFSMLENLVLE